MTTIWIPNNNIDSDFQSDYIPWTGYTISGKMKVESLCLIDWFEKYWEGPIKGLYPIDKHAYQSFLTLRLQGNYNTDSSLQFDADIIVVILNTDALF